MNKNGFEKGQNVENPRSILGKHTNNFSLKINYDNY